MIGHGSLSQWLLLGGLTLTLTSIQVIAIVTDSLTDLNILGDLKEACTRRQVPVYILLDQSCTPSFLQMCTNLSLRLDSLQVATVDLFVFL